MSIEALPQPDTYNDNGMPRLEPEWDTIEKYAGNVPDEQLPAIAQMLAETGVYARYGQVYSRSTTWIIEKEIEYDIID